MNKYYVLDSQEQKEYYQKEDQDQSYLIATQHVNGDDCRIAFAVESGEFPKEFANLNIYSSQLAP